MSLKLLVKDLFRYSHAKYIKYKATFFMFSVYNMCMSMSHFLPLFRKPKISSEGSA
jgi:hypothetical protein